MQIRIERNRRTFREYPDIMTRKQVSELMGVCLKTVSNRIKDGSLPAISYGGKTLIAKSAVIKFMGIR